MIGSELAATGFDFMREVPTTTSSRQGKPESTANIGGGGS
jgi:hypothetical protein